MKIILGCLAFVGCRAIVGLLVMAIAFWAFGQMALGAPRSLTDDAPPIVIASDAVAWGNLAEDGDLFLVYRYNLTAGFDENDNPQNWEITGVSGVLARVIDSAPPSLQDRVPRRLGHGLMGHYLSAGHGISWGSAALVVRMQGNPSLFDNVNSEDRAVNWTSGGADGETLVTESENRRDLLCSVFHELLEDIEIADSDLAAGDLVSNNVATEEGTQLAIEALPSAVNLLPDCFFVGVTSSGQEFDPSEGELREDLTTAVEATQFWARWEAWIEGEHNLPAVLVLTVAVAFTALGASVILVALTGPAYGLLSGWVVLLVGSQWVPHHLLQIAVVILAVMATLAAGYWWQRLPRG